MNNFVQKLFWKYLTNVQNENYIGLSVFLFCIIAVFWQFCSYKEKEPYQTKKFGQQKIWLSNAQV